VNIGDQACLGTDGYDRADYYYIPDIDSYYSFPSVSTLQGWIKLETRRGRCRRSSYGRL